MSKFRACIRRIMWVGSTKRGEEDYEWATYLAGMAYVWAVVVFQIWRPRLREVEVEESNCHFGRGYLPELVTGTQ